MYISITFDDGNIQQLRDYVPVMEKYNMKGTFYIITSQIGMKGKLSWNDIKMLHEEGHEIGSHTHTHPHLSRIKDEMIIFELKKSRDILERFGVQSLAYPAGDYDSRVIKYAKRYYSNARSYMEGGINVAGNDIFSLKTVSINDLNPVKKDSHVPIWTILVFHGKHEVGKISHMLWLLRNRLLPSLKNRSFVRSLKGMMAGNPIHENDSVGIAGFRELCKTIKKEKMKVITVKQGVNIISGVQNENSNS